MFKAQLKYPLLLAALALAACDGDNGRNGIDGTNGANGADGVDGAPGADGIDGADGRDGSGGTGPKLTRIATVPLGAEVTGLFLTEEGDLFFNIQHPSDANTAVDGNNLPYNKGTVGVLAGVNFNMLPKNLVDSAVPKSNFEQETVQAAYGQYQILGQGGDTYEGKLARGLGSIRSINDGKSTEIVLSNMPDFNGFIATGAGEGYLYSNWESIPGGMSRMQLKKDSKGMWTVEDAMMVDFAGVKGTGANCFGSVSPWGTPLTSEEWIVDSTDTSTVKADFNKGDALADRTKSMADFLSPEFPNPYRYGYIVEIADPLSAAPTPVKHYTLGRYEHENSVVMPDQKTVYLSQDDTNGVLFKFVADNAGDLSSGTLYAAKLTQDAGTEPLTTGFSIAWIEMGSGNNTQIESWIAEYDAISPSDYVEGQSNYMTVADVEAWRAGAATYPTVANGGGSVTAGKAMDNRAVFLESRQAAKQMGATAEWRKLEGISINAKRAQAYAESDDSILGYPVEQAYVYIAIADLDNGMVDDKGDVQLSKRVKDCGGIYRMPLGTDYDVSRIEPVVMGATYRGSLDGALRCDVNALSQPDNVIVMNDGRILIGEDGFQVNNTLWMYDPN